MINKNNKSFLFIPPFSLRTNGVFKSNMSTIKSFKDYIFSEDYHSLVTNPLNKQKRTVFVNPTKDEIRELAKETNSIRFIAYQNVLYIWNGDMLHADMIKQLKLPFTSDPPIATAFLGIAKPLAKGSLQYKDSNQLKSADAAKIAKLYGWIDKWFE